MKRIVLISGVAFGLFLSLTISELVQRQEPISVASVLLDLAETGLLVLAVATTAYLAIEMHGFRRQRANLMTELRNAQALGNRWRDTARAHIEGLGRAIRLQFDEWQLTEGEAEIAMLMLKGLSHRQIAEIRNSREATVRQQARSIYAKSQLPSRAALSAFFLEDLLPPQQDQDGETGGGSSNVARLARSVKL